MNKINDRKAEVEKKLGVLDNLRKGRSGPVKMMDAMAIAVPKKLWLKGFVEEKRQREDLRLGHQPRRGGRVHEQPEPHGVDAQGHGPAGGVSARTRPPRAWSCSPDAAIEEFPVSDIKPFFTNIELRDAVQKPGGNDANAFPIG